MHRRFLVLTLLSVLALFTARTQAAQHRTANFLVDAPNAQVAQQVGQWAEHYRREKAMLWLGYEMPTWAQPCPLRVVVSMEPPSGKTSFSYMMDRVASMDMEIQGPLDRLVYSVLPHEITHTVFAHYFRCAVPRWADEGGSVLSEDSVERDRHDQQTRRILNQKQGFRLRTLMNFAEYPNNNTGVMWLYAQGYSLSDYLVKRSDHRTFLAFVAEGMRSRSWDHALQVYFGHRNIEELEEAWLKHLRDTRHGAADPQFAQAARPDARPKTVVRTTLPTAQPLEPIPLVRGASPGPEQIAGRYGEPQGGAVTPPIYVPLPSSHWQPVSPQAASRAPAYQQVPVYQPLPAYQPQVQLGQPQYGQTQFRQPNYLQPQCPTGQCPQQPYYTPQAGTIVYPR